MLPQESKSMQWPAFLPPVEHLPILDLKDHTGATGYIDFVRADDMQFPVMRGVDVAGRPFVAIKAQTEGSCELSEVVGVFFQRYTNIVEDWAYGTCYPLNLLFHDSRVRGHHMEGLKSRLDTLMSGGVVRSLGSRVEDWVSGSGSTRLFLGH
jgi:hypothetical protein